MSKRIKHTPRPWNRDFIYWLLRYADKHPSKFEDSLEAAEAAGEFTPDPRRDVDLITAAPDLLVALEKSRRSHYHCDDFFYSCPKDTRDTKDAFMSPCEISYDKIYKCNCGADEWNAYIDEVIAKATGVKPSST